jgi:hypothetical protein
MPAWLQQLLQNGKFWIFAIAIGFSILRAVLNSLEKKAKERQIKLDRERRELEALRTGRPTDTPSSKSMPAPSPLFPQPSGPTPPSSQASAREQLEALAAKRRAAIDELQRRRAAAGPASTPPPQPTTPEQVLATILGIPTSTSPKPAPTPTQRQRSPQPKPSIPTQRASPQPPRDRRQRSQQDYATPMPMERPKPAKPTARVQQEVPEPPRRASIAETPTPPSVEVTSPSRTDPLGLHALSRSDLRRAVVLREIMDPPLTLRRH